MQLPFVAAKRDQRRIIECDAYAMAPQFALGDRQSLNILLYARNHEIGLVPSPNLDEPIRVLGARRERGLLESIGPYRTDCTGNDVGADQTVSSRGPQRP